MDIKALGELLEAIAKSEVSELNLETSDYKLQIKRDSENLFSPTDSKVITTVASPTKVEIVEEDNSTTTEQSINEDQKTESKLVEVTAPIVGTFYASSSPEAPPFVKEGDRVNAGATLCIIEAMKLMNEIEAEVSGRIVDILVRNEEPVEYGQVLFNIDPS